MKKGTFMLNESKAADEKLFVLKRESLEKKGTFPLNESKATDEKLFVLKRKSLEQRKLSAERIKGS